MLVHDNFRKPTDTRRHDRTGHQGCLQGYQTECPAPRWHHDHGGSVHQLGHVVRGDPAGEVDELFEPQLYRLLLERGLRRPIPINCSILGPANAVEKGKR